MQKYNCIECGEIYDENTIPDDYVCKKPSCPGNGLTGLIIPIETPEEETGGSTASDERAPSHTRECGLCVLLMDASGSMFFDPAFKEYSLPSQYGNEFCNKAEIISKAAAQAIFELQSMTNIQDAYICAIKFDHRQSLMFNDNIKNIIAQHQTAEIFARYLYDQLEEMKGGTDINSALTMAHSYIEKFRNSDIPGIVDFAPLYHKQYLPHYNKSENIPNIRTLIYTDGEQQEEYGSIQSPFSGGTLDLLMGAYIGEASDQGCSDLSKILSDCPIHGQRQFFVLDKPQKLATLKGLFRMASGASGFCPKCIPSKSALSFL